MKIVAVMCVEEHTDTARKLMKESRVPGFSESEIMGYKLAESDASENWFADKHSMDNSHLFFTMCEDAKADELLKKFEECKRQLGEEHVHAFVLNVEKYIL